MIAGAVLDGISAEMQASGVDLGAVEELPEEVLPEVAAEIAAEVLAPVEGAEAPAQA
jgi:small subunit ribosomal protein S2